MHVSWISRLPISIQSTVCSQGPEPRVLDGWQDSVELPPSMQYEPLCRTTQHLESRNRQSNDWKTNRLIPRRGPYPSSLGVSGSDNPDWGKVPSLPSPFWSFPLPLSWGKINACTLVGLVRAKTHPNGSHHCLFDKPFLPFFHLDHQPKSSSDHHSGSCTCPSPKNALPVLCLILFPFFAAFHLAALEWSGPPGTLSVVPCPEAWSLIINVALLASHLIFGPLPKVFFNKVFHDEGSVHAADVSAHAEWRNFQSSFSAYRTIPQTLFLQIQKCKRGHSFPEEKRNL